MKRLYRLQNFLAVLGALAMFAYAAPWLSEVPAHANTRIHGDLSFTPAQAAPDADLPLGAAAALPGALLIGNLLQRKAKLQEQLAAKVKEAGDFVAGFGDKPLAGDDLAKHQGLLEAVTTLKKNIEGVDAQIAAERAMPAVPNDPARITRAEEDAPFASFGQQLQAVIRASVPGGALDPRLKPLAAASGMNEGQGSAGGFLVQSQFSTELLDAAVESSQLYGRCRRIPVGDGFSSVTLPFIDETSRANGSRFGGVRAYRRAEAATVTASAPKIAQIKLDVEPMMALGYITDELAADATALGGIMREAFISEIGFMTDDEILNGTGAGQCMGILNSANAALISVAEESGQAADTILFENLSKMWSRMWARSRGNAIWLINQDIEPQLDKLALTVGTGGVPVYIPAGGDLSQSPFAKIKGRPVVPMEQCPTLGNLGDIALVDMSQYLVVDKGSPEVAESMHVRFIYGENTLRVMVRNNGRPSWRSALTPAKGSNTLSPYVTTATRA